MTQSPDSASSLPPAPETMVNGATGPAIGQLLRGRGTFKQGRANGAPGGLTLEAHTEVHERCIKCGLMKSIQTASQG